MPRIRTIKPEFWKSESIACYDMFTRLVFIGLWTYVDDNGVGIDNWRLIAAELFPLERNFARVSRDVRESIARLAAGGRIVRYDVESRSYLAIMNWEEHQRVDRPNKPRHPGPNDPRAAPSTREKEDPEEEDKVAVEQRFATPSRHPRESSSTGTGEQGNRGVSQKHGGNAAMINSASEPDQLAPLAALAPLDAGGVDTLSIVDKDQNAGQVVAEWIDYCRAHNVELTRNVIGRYGKNIKSLLGHGFPVGLVKRALAEMLTDRVVSRPALLDTYIIRVQTGPELPPRRMSRVEAELVRGPSAIDDLIHDILNEPS